jgi:hypothetical protein
VAISVLIVDDYVAFRRSVRARLEAEGLQVVAAPLLADGAHRERVPPTRHAQQHPPLTPPAYSGTVA